MATKHTQTKQKPKRRPQVQLTEYGGELYFSVLEAARYFGVVGEQSGLPARPKAFLEQAGLTPDVEIPHGNGTIPLLKLDRLNEFGEGCRRRAETIHQQQVERAAKARAVLQSGIASTSTETGKARRVRVNADPLYQRLAQIEEKLDRLLALWEDAPARKSNGVDHADNVLNMLTEGMDHPPQQQ